MITPLPAASLTTERLILALPSEALAAALSRFYTRNLEHFRYSSPRRADGYHTEQNWRIRAPLLAEASVAGDALHLLMFVRSEPEREIIGHINLTNIVRGAFQAAHLGYGLDRDVVGRGLLHEALNALIPYVFDHMGLNRIMANYMPTNERSGRVLRRLGFVVEGYARDYLEINGLWQDHILTARVRDRPLPTR